MWFHYLLSSYVIILNACFLGSIPMRIFRSIKRVHQNVYLKFNFCLKFSKISHRQPQDRKKRDAHGPRVAKRVTLRFSPHSLWGVSQSVGWWQCESGPLPFPIPHIKPVNVSFGFEAGVSIKAELWKKWDSSCTPNKIPQTHLQKRLKNEQISMWNSNCHLKTNFVFYL